MLQENDGQNGVIYLENDLNLCSELPYIAEIGIK